MKKVLSCIIAVLFVLSFSACSSLGSSDETTTQESSSVPVISLKTENTTVKAGDIVEITVNIAQAPLTACFDIYVVADAALIYEKNETVPTAMMMAANFENKEGIERVAIRGIVAETCDLPDNDICKITYRVSDDAVSGDVINLILQVPSYQQGIDESGNDVYSVNEELTANNLVLTVE